VLGLDPAFSGATDPQPRPCGGGEPGRGADQTAPGRAQLSAVSPAHRVASTRPSLVTVRPVPALAARIAAFGIATIGLESAADI
jgi:hypothetical protein